MTSTLPAQSPALEHHVHARAQPLSVDTGAIQDDAVTAAKIAAGAVGSSEIATDAVGSDEIAAGAVGSSEIATDAVGSDEIAANAVGGAELADGSVDTGAIVDGSVTPAKLGSALARGFRFVAFATSNSAGATAETVVLTIASVVFQDGRAYKASYGPAVASASANGEVAMTIRKTNAAGTIYGGPVRHLCGATANSTCFAEGRRYLKRATAAGDLTTDVVLTITGVIGGNAAHIGNATGLPRYLLIEDIGDADDWTHAFTVT